MLDVDDYDMFAAATAAADSDAADVSSACLESANVDCTDEYHSDGNAAGDCCMPSLLPSPAISQSFSPDNVSQASPDAAVSQKSAQYGGTQSGPDQQQRKAACAAAGLAALQHPQPAQVPIPVGLSLSESRYGTCRHDSYQHVDRVALEQQARGILKRINQLAEAYNTAAESVCDFATLSMHNRFLIQQWRHVARQYACKFQTLFHV